MSKGSVFLNLIGKFMEITTPSVRIKINDLDLYMYSVIKN